MDLNFKEPTPRRSRAPAFLLPACLTLACGIASACVAKGPEPSLSLTSADPTAHSNKLAPLLVEREVFVMGTRLRATVAADPALGFAATEAVFNEARRLEDVLSSWRGDSEMARVNASPPGVPLKLSPELLRLLQEVRCWVAWSHGAFDPGVGPLIDAWDLRGAGKRPTEAELARARALGGLDAFELNEAAGLIERRWAGSWISAGGFGKGAALRASARSLVQAGVASALLDFGGQIVALGAPPGEDAWVVEVAHPSSRQRTVATLRLTGASAATSGSSERFVEVGGRRFGHIIDPRSGWPVPAWGSVTVVADDPLVADVAATALFVLGPDEGLARAEADNDLAVLFLLEDGDRIEARWTPRMTTHLLALASDAMNWEARRATVRVEPRESAALEVMPR